MAIACQCQASIGHNRVQPAGIRRGRHTTGADLHRYAPRTALDWLAADPGLRHRPLDGTLAFFDVSGFTRLSERLGRAGKIGTETLSAIIDGLYEGMIDPVLGGGGDVLQFSGDAILALFDGPRHEERAVRAANAIQRFIAAAAGSRPISATCG